MHSAAGIADKGELFLTNTPEDLAASLAERTGGMATNPMYKPDNAVSEMVFDKPVRSGLGRVETRFGQSWSHAK